MKFSHFNGKKPNSEIEPKRIGEPQLIGYSKDNYPIYRIRYYIEHADLKVNTQFDIPFKYRITGLKYVESVVKVVATLSNNITSCTYNNHKPITWFAGTSATPVVTNKILVRAIGTDINDEIENSANYYVTIVVEKRP